VIIEGGGATIRPAKDGEGGLEWERVSGMIKDIYKARVLEWRDMTEEDFLYEFNNTVASLLP
jgi:hypothetical protein